MKSTSLGKYGNRRHMHIVVKACLLLVLAGTVVTCSDQPTSTTSTAETRQLQIGIATSRADALVGQRLTVAVRNGWGPRLAGLQGYLRFDPSLLAYQGQFVEGSTATLINSSVPGELRMASLNVHGLDKDVVRLSFEVLDQGYRESLRFETEVAVAIDESVIRELTHLPGTRIDERLGVLGSSFRRMSLEDWIETLGSTERDGDGELTKFPGQIIDGLAFGDADLNGIVNINDAFFLANVGVGNFPLLADETKDHVVAGNTRPANLPGLGEPSDDLPPGEEANGRRIIDVQDALASARYGAGLPSDIAGEPIPGRTAEPANRVVVSGVFDSARTFTADTIYELQGRVDVPHGVLLTIEAGTIVEGDPSTRGALVVHPGGGLLAVGTQLQPIVFRCLNAAPGHSCWGGVSILGFSTLNPIPAPAPAFMVGADFTPCPTRTVSGIGTYGGCLGDDNSGELHYVRIEGAGMPIEGGDATPGLQLLGLGSETRINSVQVHESGGDGISISGGRVDVMKLIVSRQLGSGIAWDDGWTGRGQYLIVQAGSTVEESAMLDGSNSPFEGGHNNTPRSEPQLFNVTLFAAEIPNGGTLDGVRLRNGTAGQLRNMLILNASGAGVDIDSVATCTQAGAGGGLRVEYTMLYGNTESFSSDADCIDEQDWVLATMAGNRVDDPLLFDPANLFIPDLRPAQGSPAESGASVPPTDGFFDATAIFLGAVSPAPNSTNRVPWYSGWTVGTQVP